MVGPRRCLSEGEKWQIIGLCNKAGNVLISEQGGEKKCATEFNVSQSVVSHLVQKETETGRVCQSQESV